MLTLRALPPCQMSSMLGSHTHSVPVALRSPPRFRLILISTASLSQVCPNFFAGETQDPRPCPCGVRSSCALTPSLQTPCGRRAHPVLQPQLGHGEHRWVMLSTPGCRAEGSQPNEPTSSAFLCRDYPLIKYRDI